MGNASIADLPPHIQKQVREKLEAERERGRTFSAQTPIPEKPKKRKAKYNNVRTKFKSVQGFEVTADSKLEAKLFRDLDAAMVAGATVWWIPHPRFPLPGGVVYEADALAIIREVPGNSASHVFPRVYDAKGFDRQDGKNKRKQVFALFGIDVEIVRK